MSSEAQSPLAGMEDLPVLTELNSPDWGLDFATLCEQLFRPGRTGLMRTEAGELVACRGRDIRTLAARPDLGGPCPSQLAEPYGSEGNGWEQVMKNHLFSMNPPLHQPARQLFARQFVAGKAHSYRWAADRAADEVISEALGKERLDLSWDFAVPITAKFWSRVLGMSPADAARASDLAWEVGKALRFHQSDDDRAQINRSALEYLGLVSESVDRSLSKGTNRLLDEMSHEFNLMNIEGQPGSVGIALAANLFDGFHTMGIGLGNIIYALLEADQMPEVRRDPTVIPAACLEANRLHPAVIFSPRMFLADVQYEGLTIESGTSIQMMWLLGNRDPEAFDSPHSFELGRSWREQTTFGGGLRICPGRNVARVLAEATLSRLAAQSIDIEAIGEPEWLAGANVHQLESMPVRVDRA